MIKKIFTVYDSKVESFMSPMFMHHRGEAIRSFSETARDKSNNLGKYPADFTLFELGEYDESNATFNLHSTPISLGTALELVGPDT